MLDGRGGDAERDEGASGGGFQPAGGRVQPQGERETFSADLDDEIPF
jgi:single-strand DNA-binding protein